MPVREKYTIIGIQYRYYPVTRKLRASLQYFDCCFTNFVVDFRNISVNHRFQDCS